MRGVAVVALAATLLGAPIAGAADRYISGIEAFATTAAKANADAQMAAMNAESARDRQEAAIYAAAATEAADDARSAADAAGEALTIAEGRVREDPESVATQAQLELATTAADKARLHAEAAADAAARAIAARWSARQ